MICLEYKMSHCGYYQLYQMYKSLKTDKKKEQNEQLEQLNITQFFFVARKYTPVIRCTQNMPQI